MEKSVEIVHQELESHQVIYGVNTGVGNADARSKEYRVLQKALLQHQQSGIILPDIHAISDSRTCKTCMPLDVVRGLIMVRCNSLLKGNSGIRKEVVEKLALLVSHNVTPLIPLRGSISASGDLSPLSYLGGSLEGSPGVQVYTPNANRGLEVTTAAEALARFGISPTAMEPKESLAIMNGTSVSAAYATLVLHDCHDLAITCQLLTAMTAEALKANLSNYHPILFEVRPHSGSIEAARNITEFLQGSKICKNTSDANSGGLAQDRIGPQIEDLLLADRQLSIELNSTTDNPIVDLEARCVRNGGNFQAASVTSAMEKARGSIVMLGRLILAQVGEMVNPVTNKGLTPNLCADEPSTSFACKGADINVTAYFSELAFYANSVSSHVQTAELGNQSVNSLALISARMTQEANDLLSMMISTHLFTVCQALDIRTRNEEFLSKAKISLQRLLDFKIAQFFDEAQRQDLFDSLWRSTETSWENNNRLDGKDRCNTVAKDMISALLEYASFRGRTPCLLTVPDLQNWQEEQSNTLLAEWKSVKGAYLTEQATPKYLGKASLGLYNFIRSSLDIPFHKGVQDHPSQDEFEENKTKLTIGGQISKI